MCTQTVVIQCSVELRDTPVPRPPKLDYHPVSPISLNIFSTKLEEPYLHNCANAETYCIAFVIL